MPPEARPRENARQRQFLLLTDVNEVFYGGAAGGGKTYATLIAAAQYVDVPDYAALLLRENYGDLAQPKAWLPLSKAWWYNKAHYNATERRWYFPSGATITFGYLSRDDAVYQYDTASYQYIAIDELTQHSEWRYRFMFNRLRRPATGPLSRVPTRMRSASNPGNKGHEWVKKRFVGPRTREPGAVFVPARLEDNAGNLDVDAYRRDSLSKLDPFTRAQREKGDWDAVAGGKFWPQWFEGRTFRRQGNALVLACGRRVRWSDCWLFQTVDTASSVRTSADYTVISTWAVTPDNLLLWLWCTRFRGEIPAVLQAIRAQYAYWKPKYVGIEAVAAHSGTAIYQLLRRERMAVWPLAPSGDPLVNATEAIVLASTGRIYLPAWEPWLEDCLAEVIQFTGDERKDAHNDVVATWAYAGRILAGKAPQGTGTAPRVYGGAPR